MMRRMSNRLAARVSRPPVLVLGLLGLIDEGVAGMGVLGMASSPVIAIR